MKLFLKKLSLAIIGIILSLVLLECGLRLAGWTISSYQQYKNNKALRNKSQYTIMCLGESTTAWQYPIQLQKILDKKYPNTFSIIDCGLGGTILESILDLLNDNINKYNPDIAICMMGINNSHDFIGETENNEIQNNNNYIIKIKKTNLKIIRLLFLLLKHLSFENELFANSQKEQNLLDLAINLSRQDKLDEAHLLFKKVLETSEEDSEDYRIAYTKLLINYLGRYDDDCGVQMAINAIKRNYGDKPDCYHQLIDYLSRKGRISELKTVLSLLLNEKDFLPSIDTYNLAEPYLKDSEKTILLNKIISRKENVRVMAIQQLKQKNYKKAQEYFDKAEELRVNFPDIETYNLYKLIVKKLIDNNIKVICMQYPIRSILPLQEQLKNEPYYDKITFISNEKLFKDALMKKNYDDLFCDQFAGDFGHCTDLGNTLIAKNIVNTLENILDLKQN